MAVRLRPEVLRKIKIYAVQNDVPIGETIEAMLLLWMRGDVFDSDKDWQRRLRSARKTYMDLVKIGEGFRPKDE